MAALKTKRGFTLIEMLVSMVILSTVIVIATQAYRQFIVNSERFSQRYQRVLSETQLQSLLFERIEQSVLYVAKAKDIFGIEKNAVYWQGLPNELIAVTKISLQDPRRSAVYKISVIEGDLVYCESMLDGWIAQIGRVPENICDFSVTIIPEVTTFSLKYYGWKSSAEMLQALSSEFLTGTRLKQQWFNSYDGQKTELLPEWVELSIGKHEESDVWLFPVKYHDSDRLTLLYTEAE